MTLEHGAQNVPKPRLRARAKGVALDAVFAVPKMTRGTMFHGIVACLRDFILGR